MPPQEKSFTTNVPMLIAAFVLLCGVSIWIYGYNRSNSNMGQDGQTSGDQVPAPEKTKENVSVQQVDLTTNPSSKTPAGFPSFITISQSAVITQSYKSAFPDRKMTQYTVSFTTSESLRAVSDFYSNLMKQNEYTLTSSTNTDNSNAFYGTKNNNDLSIGVSRQSEVTTVTIGYLERGQ